MKETKETQGTTAQGRTAAQPGWNWARAAAAAAVAVGMWFGGAGEAWAQGATWIGNSFLVVNGTWYNGSGSGNTARPDSFGNLSSIELGAEIQSYGDSDGAWPSLPCFPPVLPFTGNEDVAPPRPSLWEGMLKKTFY
jgi:hypothetical protein